MQNANWKNSKLNEQLKAKLISGPERGGFILSDGTIIEFENASEEPTEGFSPNLDQLHEVIDKDVVATWHTHPEASANLSVEDWETFIQWPNQQHAIIGTNGIRWYQAVKGAIVNV